MPKGARAVGDADVRLDPHATTPLYRQLYERIRQRILDGQLAAGSRLPSTRALAVELGISRTTTALAYQMLILEGYVESRVGDGARVARVCPSPAPASSAERAGPARVYDAANAVAALDAPAARPAMTAREAQSSRIFSVGIPDVTQVPWQTWSRLVARHARHALSKVAQRPHVAGYAPLREAIAGHVAITRGVRCTADDIIITAGSQGALHLVAATLLAPGDQVWLEDPGYFGARGAVLAAGARAVPVPVDGDGLDVAVGRRLCPTARLAIVTPSHQFPTGVAMSLARRVALLEWAATARAWIVEDDYDSEYRYCGRPLEALQALDAAGRVLYVGTFSKTLFPALRIGYLVAPPALRAPLLATRSVIDAGRPPLEQMALADFIATGQYSRHIRRMQALYRERRDALIATLEHELGGTVEVSVPPAGLHLVVWLRDALDAHNAVSLDLGVEMVSREASPPGERAGLLLGYANGTPDDLRTGAQQLASALRRTSG
ncbi:MAG TPA: PLP-dependent aminotransferase family protein [Steroidobacteraceae bacterium]|nr:PLP-dependent aminotransferase family protein [Steroidobacteraceae bacterium]